MRRWQQSMRGNGILRSVLPSSSKKIAECGICRLCGTYFYRLLVNHLEDLDAAYIFMREDGRSCVRLAGRDSLTVGSLRRSVGKMGR